MPDHPLPTAAETIAPAAPAEAPPDVTDLEPPAAAAPAEASPAELDLDTAAAAAPAEASPVGADLEPAAAAPVPAPPAQAGLESVVAVQASPAVADLAPAACSARLAELFPAVFAAATPRPLKLRIQADIQQRAPGIFTRKTLSVFLHRHTTGTAYLKSVAGAPERVDLDGLPAGAVADEHRQAATAELQRRRSSHDERRAAERDAAREAGRKAQDEVRDAQRKTRDDAREADRKVLDEAREAQRKVRDEDRETQRKAQEAARQVNEAEGQGRAERAALLRAFDATTLTRSNFCALKRISEADLDAALATARQDRERQAQALRSPPAERSARAERPAGLNEREPRSAQAEQRPERPQAGRGEREPHSTQLRPPQRRPPGPPKPSE